MRLPQPGEAKRGEEGYLLYLLRQATLATRAEQDRALADLGATLPQFTVLTMINAYPGASGAELARLALLTPQTMTVITRNLERSGAIRRAPDPAHGRIVRYALTEEGERLLAACRTRVLAVEARAEALVGKEEARIVRRWLAAVSRGLPDERAGGHRPTHRGED